MEELPNEILLSIMQYLSLQDLGSLFSVCWRFASYSQNPSFWKNRLIQDYPSVPCPRINDNSTFYLSLYRYWKQFKFGRAKVISIPKKYYPPKHPWTPQNQSRAVHFINKNPTLLHFIKSQGARRGDIIYLETISPLEDDDDLREDFNCGRMIFDGSQVCLLDTSLDPNFGGIPSSFFVLEEFPCDFWVGALVNTSYCFFCNVTPYIEEILQSLTQISKNRLLGTFSHWTGIQYYIVIPISNGVWPHLDFCRRKLQEGIFMLGSFDRCVPDDYKDRSLFLNLCIVYSKTGISYE